jgi:chemotaxis protein methyltransferase CheR
MSTKAQPRALEPRIAAIIEERLKEASGITLANGLRGSLSLCARNAAKAVHLSIEDFADRVQEGDPRCVRELIEHCSVKETFFFRHPEHFDALSRHVFPDLRTQTKVNIWSAAASSGEEPYSLAMACLDARLSGVKIIATDIAETALRVARTATYSPHSVRRLKKDKWLKYFAPSGRPATSTFRVAPEVTRLVEFIRWNLVTQPAPSQGFDIIFCRNVLIYFEPPTAELVVQKLWNALAPGGHLVLGPVENALAAALPADRITEGQALLLRKHTPDSLRRKAEAEARMAEKPRTRPMRVVGPRVTPGQVIQKLLTPVDRPQHSPPPNVGVAPGSQKGRGPDAEKGRALYDRACVAARRGDLFEAERLADLASRELVAEAFLILAMAAEARGELDASVKALRRALYLDAELAIAHATLVSLFRRLGDTESAERSRRNALRILSKLEDAEKITAVETITAGTLRRALANSGVGVQ